jgi:hypothetical protein
MAVPGWVKLAAMGGLGSSLVALGIAVYPIVNVVSRGAYAAKVGAVVALTNATGIGIHWSAHRR